MAVLALIKLIVNGGLLLVFCYFFVLIIVGAVMAILGINPLQFSR